MPCVTEVVNRLLKADCTDFTPQLAGGNPLVGPNSFTTLGEGPRLVPPKREFPLLIVPTPEGWKAEYTLASRMQIHESLTVLAHLTKGEARTSDPRICSLMLYHLSYLTTYMHTCIHAYMHTCIHAYIHTYIHTYIASISELLCLIPYTSGELRSHCMSP